MWLLSICLMIYERQMVQMRLAAYVFWSGLDRRLTWPWPETVDGRQHYSDPSTTAGKGSGRDLLSLQPMYFVVVRSSDCMLFFSTTNLQILSQVDFILRHCEGG